LATLIGSKLRISEESDVDVVGDGDQPEGVPEQRGNEPVLPNTNKNE
jgi:hypothetical protein